MPMIIISDLGIHFSPEPSMKPPNIITPTCSYAPTLQLRQSAPVDRLSGRGENRDLIEIKLEIILTLYIYVT